MKALDADWSRLVQRAYRRGFGELHKCSLGEVRAYLASDNRYPEPPMEIYQPTEGVHFARFGQQYDRKMPALIMLVGSAYVWYPNLRLKCWAHYLSEQLGWPVFLLYHRLAPEHKFPTPYNDAFAGFEWIMKNAATLNIEEKQICLLGESSGGAMAAAITHQWRDMQMPSIAHQVLFYPICDWQMTPSRREYANGFLMDIAYQEWAVSHYLNSWDERADPRVVPLHQKNFSNLPDTTMVLAEHDGLKDEGYAYAHKLQAAGNQLSLRVFEGVTHAFASFAPAIKASSLANAWVVERLKCAVGS